MLSGTCQLRVGDEVLELGPRDSVVVDPEEWRSFHNPSDEDCWLIVIGAPIDEFTAEGVAAYLEANGYPPGAKL